MMDLAFDDSEPVAEPPRFLSAKAARAGVSDNGQQLTDAEIEAAELEAEAWARRVNSC